MGYAYLDYSGVLHITKHKELAKEYGQKGVYIETDLPAAHGYPVDDYGNFIIITRDKDSGKFYCRNQENLGSWVAIYRVIDLYTKLEDSIPDSIVESLIDVIKSVFRGEFL